MKMIRNGFPESECVTLLFKIFVTHNTSVMAGGSMDWVYVSRLLFCIHYLAYILVQTYCGCDNCVCMCVCVCVCLFRFLMPSKTAILR